MKKCKFIYLAMLGVFAVSTAQALPYDQKYWNQKLQIEPFRLPLPPVGYQVEYIDLNGDGKPDAIKSVTVNDTPILWLDDDGNMKEGDIEGDMINDCLLIDRNKDGIYGGQGDLIIDWVDTDDDGKADMQIVIEYPEKNTGEVWPNGHYMIMRDLDKDNIFNYINWNDFSLRCWDKNGVCDFYEDYSGQTMFMKIHTSTYDIKDLRLNWENPFLFYDEDGDGLTEMAIRFVDSPKIKDRSKPSNSYVNRQLEGRIDWVSMAVDLDNDNGPGNEFDFDFTIGFQGKGFDYTDQVHKVNNLRGMPEAEFLFALGAFHQGVFADGSQRVERLHTVDGYIAAKNVLNVHNIEVLPVEYLLQRVHPQGVTHDLGTDLTVHITRKVVAQRGESDDAGCDQKQHRQYAE